MVFLKKPGELVAEGDEVAQIINPLAVNSKERTFSVRCTIDGILFAHRGDNFARPGRILAKIAGENPIDCKAGNLLTP